MFEPVHGSAPPLAGKNVANPMGAILSAALMLDYLGLRPEAASIEAAVHEAVASGNGTKEIGGSLGTSATGDYIAEAVRRSRKQESTNYEVGSTNVESTTATE
jgi:isocitrate/isopropylmalate dehydrogenase